MLRMTNGNGKRVRLIIGFGLRLGLKVAEYAPNQVKKTVTGVGHSDKKQIRAMIGYLLPKAQPKTDDEADALAIAICHAQHRGMSRIAKQLRETARVPV